MQRDRDEETGTRARLSMACAVLGLSVLTAACNVETKWQEEVRLSDERVIVLDRRTLSIRSGFPNSARGPNLEQEIEYKPMRAKWKVGARPLLEVMSFDIIDGVPYLAAVTSDKSVCERHGEGGYESSYFKWDAKQGWVEVSQPEVPLDRLRQNLLLSTLGKDPDHDPKGLVTLEQKGMLDRSYHTEPLKAFFGKRPWLSCSNGK